MATVSDPLAVVGKQYFFIRLAHVVGEMSLHFDRH